MLHNGPCSNTSRVPMVVTIFTLTRIIHASAVSGDANFQ
jgi:hypothetical protein